ncbi:sterol desaturase family protein [Porticoccus sp.]
MQRVESTSIRLFKNPLLESLTHVHPIIPLVLWTPIALALIWRSFSVYQMPLAEFGEMACAGLLIWTFMEYGLHRFVFHYEAGSKLGKSLVFLFHGVHHDDPQDKTRLVMPPAGAILIMAFLWLLFALFLSGADLETFGAFFIIGYLCYDYIHYATHHFPMRNRVLRYLKRYHMLHHFSGQDGRYGVSSPLWDFAFGTTAGNLPPPPRKKED